VQYHNVIAAHTRKVPKLRTCACTLLHVIKTSFQTFKNRNMSSGKSLVEGSTFITRFQSLYNVIYLYYIFWISANVLHFYQSNETGYACGTHWRNEKST
jgi:hypothetical protein